MSLPTLLWDSPPRERKLGARDVHVWAAGLDQSPGRLSSLKQTLSPDEQCRAGRFHFERDRHRFIAGRGILREILGSYTDIHPAQLRFDYCPRGKPILADSSELRRLHFNLGHSEDLMVLAVTRACIVGVDIERIREIPEMERIVVQYFSAGEAAQFMASPKDRKLRAFYRLWTRKEAILKASDEGISGLAKDLDFPFPPPQSAQVRAMPENSAINANWTWVELTAAPGYVAALAAPVADVTCSCWRWPV